MATSVPTEPNSEPSIPELEDGSVTSVLHSKAHEKCSAENSEVELGARKPCINYSRKMFPQNSSAGKMAQQVRVLAAEPGSLSLKPGAQTVGGEN